MAIDFYSRGIIKNFLRTGSKIFCETLLLQATAHFVNMYETSHIRLQHCFSEVAAIF